MVIKTRAPRTGKHLLSDRELRSIVVKMKPGDHPDGHRLILSIVPAQNRCAFVFNMPPGCKKREVGLGPARPDPTAAIKVARAKADKANEMILAGKDPTDFLSGAATAVEARGMTFREACAEFIRIRSAKWRPGTTEGWINNLRCACGDSPSYPVGLGDWPIADILQKDIATILEPAPPHTRERRRFMLHGVFEWAATNGHYDPARRNPAKFILGNVMAQPELRVEHLKPMPFMEVPAFFAKLQRVNGVDRILALCLMWHILTASRPEESRGILWTEIDFENHVWNPPFIRMKCKEDHSVPLSEAAWDILEKRIAAGGMARDKLIFPNPRARKKNQGFGQNNYPALMAKILEIPDSVPKKDRYKPHAFRSSFMDWVRKQRDADGRPLYDKELQDLALAHVVGNKARQAYAHDDLVEERRGMMEHWARFVCSVGASDFDEHVRQFRIAKSPILSKADAAAALGLNRSTFSEMLRRGAIRGEAIVDEGQKTRINLEAACQQLNIRNRSRKMELGEAGSGG